MLTLRINQWGLRLSGGDTLGVVLRADVWLSDERGRLLVEQIEEVRSGPVESKEFWVSYPADLRKHLEECVLQLVERTVALSAKAVAERKAQAAAPPKPKRRD